MSRHQKIFLKLQAQIDSIVNSAIFYKPSMAEFSGDFCRVWEDPTFKKLPNYLRDRIYHYAEYRKQQVKKEYTILLSIGLDQRKFISNWDNLTEDEKNLIRDGKSLQSIFFWLEKKEICSESGLITVTYTPTEKIYYIPSF